MSAAPVRVLVVDDSAFARKVVREVLTSDARIEVVGIARDGLEALEQIQELTPDVVTLDLVMPNLDGLGVLASLPAAGAPGVVVVSISDADSALGIEALSRGAFDLVHKPTALPTDRLYELRVDLIEKVLAAAESRRGGTCLAGPVVERETSTSTSVSTDRGTRLLVIGTSTGGPQALTRLLAALPAGLPVPVAIALHIPEGYTEALAARLDRQGPLRVVEATKDVELRPGLVVLAKGGMNLEIRPRGQSLFATPRRSATSWLYTPSVDLLFGSAAAAVGAGALGLVLTGMGDDGLEGARAIQAAGGRVLTEAASSCVVYGMPRCVVEAGLSAAAAPLLSLPALIARHL